MLFVRLFRQFILRRMAQERARTVTTVVGIALGIAVVIAIQLTNGSSVRGFESALNTVAGRASLEILGTSGVDENLLRDLGWLREFGAISPVIEGEMAIAPAPGSTGVPARGQVPRRPARRSEAVKVLGVDILRDLTLRDYAVGERDTLRQNASPTDAMTSQQFLELLTSPRSIVITEKMARRRGYALGGEIRLMAGDRVNTYVIRGLLKDEGPARVMDGSFVLMDIAAAQLAFDRLGRVDRVDVQLTGAGGVAPTTADIDASLAAIASRLPAGLTAQRPGRRGEQVERMLAAFHLNLTALSWVALVVGLFLIYNTVTISVIARRDEIGVLRALGVTRRQVLALFLSEAAVLGLAGTVLGIGIGRVMADAAVGLTSSTVSTLYIATAAATPSLAPWHIALAFAIGLPLSLLSALLPAREASQVSPTAAMRGADRLESRVRLRPSAVVVPALVLAGAVGLAQLGPVDGRPLFGYASSFAMIIGASLLVPAIIYALAKLLGGALRRVLGVEGLLAHANLAAAIPRLSISVAALAVSLSMMVAVAVMIGSFRDTVAYWIGQTLQADLFIGPGVQPTAGSEQTLSAPVIEAVRAHPDVEAVDSFRNVDLVYNGNLVVLGAGNFGLVLSHGSLLFKTPSDGREALRRAIGTESVVVSEAFANKYHAKPGDTITLQTPRGAASVRGGRRLLRLRGGSRRDRDGSRHLRPLLRRPDADRDCRLPEARRRSRAGAGADSRGAGRRPSRVHLHQPRPARRGAADLRQHLCHHLRAGDHRHRGRDARRGRHPAHAGAGAPPRAVDAAPDRRGAAPGAARGGHRGGADRRGEPGHRPGGRAGVVGGAGLRHQRAELRMDHSVSRSHAVPRAGVGGGDCRDGGGRHLSRTPRGAAGGGS